MKLFKKLIFLLALVATTTLTSCVDEVQSTTVATQDMVEQSASAQTAMLYGIPSAMLACNDDFHFWFGYASMMVIRDCLTGDMARDQGSGYDSFWSWEQNAYMGRDYNRASFTWNYYYDLINAANNVISSVNPEDATPEQLGILGAGLTFRALAYTDLAQMYEVKANDILPEVDGQIINAKGNDIKGLTVPIITEKTTEEESHNTPRATREEIFNFIETDLLNAVDYLPGFEISDKTFPHIDCAYGLLARLYLWHGDYEKAYEAAMNAIENSSVPPISSNKALSLTSGFNDANDFMWAGQFSKENRAVTSGIINWTSQMSNETYFGYAGGGQVYVEIDASLYHKIGDNDWRKLLWKAPEGSLLEGLTPFIDDEWGGSLPDYSSVKFRPGQGEMSDYTVAAACAFPVMRVEEMFFIAAEAAARVQGPAAGVAILSDFMQNYRNSDYSCEATSLEDVIEEIILQKRIELWGEGQTFFDIKRLNIPVTRGYDGSNHDPEFQFNSNGTFPGWMNYVIPRTEENNNGATMDYATPDPSDKYTPWGGGAESVRSHRVLKLK